MWLLDSSLRKINSLGLVFLLGVCVVYFALPHAKSGDDEPSDRYKSILMNTTDSEKSEHHFTEPVPKYKITVLVMDKRRMGNLLFSFATLMCTAWTNNLQPILYPNFHLREQFNLNVSLFTSETFNDFKTSYGILTQRGMAWFDERLENIRNIARFARKNIALSGYFQSWKFFDRCRDRLREHLRFFPETLQEAVDFFKTILPGISFKDGVWPKVLCDNCTLVGIHVRRRDVVGPVGRKIGYTFPTMAFFHNATQYFVKNTTDVHFVVCSDDIGWCEAHLSSLHPNMSFSKGHSPEVDIAILSMCEHVVMTTGTYGWWAGWLANGKTVFYKHWPAKGSKLSRGVQFNDFFMPEWIPME